MNKSIIALTFILGISISTKAFSMEWSTITLFINGIEATRGGQICVYIFGEDGFPIKHKKALKKFCLESTQMSEELEIDVPNIPFAIKIHHDEDRSGTLTKNWTGFIPAEGLGFSSGAKLGFGPPSFNDAVMLQPEDDETEIKLIYP